MTEGERELVTVFDDAGRALSVPEPSGRTRSAMPSTSRRRVSGRSACPGTRRSSPPSRRSLRTPRTRRRRGVSFVGPWRGRGERRHPGRIPAVRRCPGGVGPLWGRSRRGRRVPPAASGAASSSGIVGSVTSAGRGRPSWKRGRSSSGRSPSRAGGAGGDGGSARGALAAVRALRDLLPRGALGALLSVVRVAMGAEHRARGRAGPAHCPGGEARLRCGAR
jgi:hypothetical protein